MVAAPDRCGAASSRMNAPIDQRDGV
jgi:hypothetical protein